MNRRFKAGLSTDNKKLTWIPAPSSSCLNIRARCVSGGWFLKRNVATRHGMRGAVWISFELYKTGTAAWNDKLKPDTPDERRGASRRRGCSATTRGATSKKGATSKGAANDTKGKWVTSSATQHRRHKIN